MTVGEAAFRRLLNRAPRIQDTLSAEIAALDMYEYAYGILKLSDHPWASVITTVAEESPQTEMLRKYMNVFVVTKIYETFGIPFDKFMEYTSDTMELLIQAATKSNTIPTLPK